MTEPDKIELVRRLSQGSHEAFDTLFREYYGRVSNFVQSLVRSRSVAEDLTQDLFANLWNARHALPEIHSFNAYVYTMARNISIDYIRRRHMSCEPIEQGAELTDGNIAEERYYATEKELLIRLAVEHFPERRRRIFSMSRFEGLSNDEISSMLGISKKTVENQINLATRDLRRLIGIF